MPGLIEYSYGKNGKQPIYCGCPVALAYETKQLGKKNKNKCLAILILATLGFYSFGIHTYDNDLVYGQPNCPSDLFIFVVPAYLIFFALISIYQTYTHCFVIQILDCRRTKHNYAYFQAISFYLPMWFTALTTCYVVPITFKLATFGLCTVFASLFLVSRNYSRRHCQCKTCLGIKDVLLKNDTMKKEVDERTQFDETELLNWLNINMSRGAQLAIQIEGGEIIHTFTRDSPKIQLKPGCYKIRVMERAHLPVCPPKMPCKPARTPSDHLVKEKSVSAKKDEMIMNID